MSRPTLPYSPPLTWGRLADLACESPRRLVPAWSVAAFAGLVLATWLACGGRFFYSLDDAYIHLALAAQLAHGHYGINPGEAAAPSSSVLWPFLLVPFARLAGFAYVPLIVNGALVAAYAALVTRVLEPWFPGRPRRVAALGLALVFGSSAVGLALTGLEHVLQLVCVAWLVLCVGRSLRGEGVPGHVLVPLVLGPLVRYEMLALSVPLALYLAYLGAWRTALAALALSALSLGVFSWFLVSQGLAPLPASVLAKADVLSGDGGGAGLLASAATTAYRALTAGSRGLVLTTVALLALGLAKGERARALGATVLVAALGHAAFGRFGWFHRYELYLWSYAWLVLLLIAAPRLSARALWVGLCVFALASLEYLGVLVSSPIAARNIASQQGELARLARAYDAPIAVNDLGVVAFESRHYVLDFGGLANPEARRAHRSEPDGAWMERMAAAHGVEAALIYDDWFDDLVPEHWQKLAELRLIGPCLTPASDRVSVYVRTPAGKARMAAALQRFVPDAHDQLVQGGALTATRKRAVDRCQE